MVFTKSARQYLVRFWDNFNKHDLLTLAAALAFYTALSLAPLLLITISVLGLLGNHSQHELATQVQLVIGKQAGEAVYLIIQSAQNRSDLSTFGGVIGVIFLLFTASGVFSQLQYSLNLIWEVKAAATSGIWSWVRHKLISMGMVLSLGFMSAVSLIISAVLSFMVTKEGALWFVVNQLVTLMVFSVLFAAIYKILPDRFLLWRHALLGGSITALLFTLGKVLIGLYLGKSAVGSAYGATGSLLVFLIWVYYSAMTLFIGAEITATLGPTRKTEAATAEHSLKPIGV